MATRLLGGLNLVSGCPGGDKTFEGILTRIVRLRYVILAYMITLEWLNELPGIDREVKSDLAGGSKHPAPRATHVNPSITQKYTGFR